MTPPPSRWQKVCALAGWIGLAILLGWTALGLSARWFWLGEICVNFFFQLAWGGLAAALLLGLGRRRWPALLALAVSAAHLWPVGRLYLPAATRPEASGGPVLPLLKVAQANLLYKNRHQEKLLPWIEREDPDLLALFEYSPAWRSEVEPALEARYPHRLVSPDFHDPWSPAVYGMALYSKLPFERAEVIPTGADSQEYLEAWLRTPDQLLHAIVLHPNRPGAAERTAARNRVLAQVATSAHPGGPTIVFSDMNATLYSPAYVDFMAATGLTEARQGFGRLATWCSEKYVPGLWLDLDHLLVGDGIEVLDIKRGEDLHSDHRPLVALLRLAPGLAGAGARGLAR